MSKIRVKTRTDEYNNIAYYKSIDIISELPMINELYNNEQVIEIKQINIDVENNDDCFDYEYYEIVTAWENYNEEFERTSYYVAIKIDWAEAE